MVFATKGCSVVYFNKGKYKLVTQGHYKGELWGLATNNSIDTFVTGGDDCTVRMWDIKSRSEVRRVNYENKVRGIDWSNDGQKIVVADSKAKIYLYDSSLSLCDEYKGAPFKNNQSNSSSDGWVEEIKFAPNSELIAYGSHGISKSL